MIQENPKYDEYRERLNTFSQEFDAGLFIHLLKKSLLWVILVILLSLVAGKLYLYYTPQVYEAKATLQLQEADAANRVLDVSPFSEESSLEAKVELIRSNLLIAECLKNFPLEVSYFTQGEILESENYVLSPYRIEVLERKSLQGIGKPIFINFEGRKFEIELNGKTYSDLTVGEIIDLDWIAFRAIVVDPEHLREIQDNDQFYFVVNNESALV
ncbi:MAG: Wzz/FepE/Etk N-terminal domain-containing protein, partial [Flavobacteriales bacterium]